MDEQLLRKESKKSVSHLRTKRVTPPCECEPKFDVARGHQWDSHSLHSRRSPAVQERGAKSFDINKSLNRNTGESLVNNGGELVRDFGTVILDWIRWLL